MSNSSVPHPFRILCEMGGKPQTFGVRAFPPLRQKSAAADESKDLHFVFWRKGGMPQT
jgi:hypothetical protein